MKTKTTTFTFKSSDSSRIFVYKWEPLNIEIKGLVQISHGMAETAARYKRFAKALNKKGFIVYANDHRGHGRTCGNIEELGYLGDSHGFRRLVHDMARLSTIIKNDHPGLPLYLFSHSMGSFAAQRYIIDYQDKIDGLILSGSNGDQGLNLKIGKMISKIEMKLRGPKAPSKLMNFLSFGLYNIRFRPRKTGNEWLTRDKEELEKYMNNPYCGTIFPTSFYYSFLNNLQYIEDVNNYKKIDKELAIFIISGDMDPVGNFAKGVNKLYKRYRKFGLKDLELKLYKGARHELLNEINRGQVTRDIVQWLKNKIS